MEANGEDNVRDMRRMFWSVDLGKLMIFFLYLGLQVKLGRVKLFYIWATDNVMFLFLLTKK